jgi:hypothetical protein
VRATSVPWRRCEGNICRGQRGVNGLSGRRNGRGVLISVWGVVTRNVLGGVRAEGRGLFGGVSKGR